MIMASSQQSESIVRGLENGNQNIWSYLKTAVSTGVTQLPKVCWTILEFNKKSLEINDEKGRIDSVNN